MRTTSFILAFAFILAGPSMAGSSDQNLPGVGTFAYQGSPVSDAGVPADGGGRQVSVAELLQVGFAKRRQIAKIADKGSACWYASVLP